MSREIDEEIAVKVMGFKRNQGSETWFRSDDPEQRAIFKNDHKFSPSTSIADAWLVVEKMRKEKGWEFAEVLAEKIKGPQDEIFGAVGYVVRLMDLLSPMEICLAALAAIGEHD